MEIKMKKLIRISILLLMIGCILLIGCKTENVYPVQVVTKTVKCDSIKHHHHDDDQIHPNSSPPQTIVHYNFGINNCTTGNYGWDQCHNICQVFSGSYSKSWTWGHNYGDVAQLHIH